MQLGRNSLVFRAKELGAFPLSLPAVGIQTQLQVGETAHNMYSI